MTSLQSFQILLVFFSHVFRLQQIEHMIAKSRSAKQVGSTLAGRVCRIFLMWASGKRVGPLLFFHFTF
uniref:Secreted protein n=1 Tax=Kalanchoe fedtschenkoi TaxID=63787 RepID=A0A7N0UX67_KALFE